MQDYITGHTGMRYFITGHLEIKNKRRRYYVTVDPIRSGPNLHLPKNSNFDNAQPFSKEEAESTLKIAKGLNHDNAYIVNEDEAQMIVILES